METPAFRKPVPVVRSEFNEIRGTLSPDDSWIAEPGRKRAVFVDKERGMTAVEVKTGASFELATPPADRYLNWTNAIKP